MNIYFLITRFGKTLKLNFYISDMKRNFTKSFLILAGILSASAAFSQCEPFFGKLVINEVMPANNSTAVDPDGEFEDWVEIYNASEEPINMEGYFLSDNHGDRTKYVFPDVVIDPSGFLIIWCDDQIDQEGLHAPFRLSADGEEVGLYNPDSTSLDYVRYGSIPDDISVGRFPNGAGPFNRLIPTFNESNTNSVDPGLVINEYQAINESTAQDQWGGYEDWVELYNNSEDPIDLTGYFLSDKIGDPTQFTFPDTILQPDSYMIIWCDQGLMEPGLHTFFKLGSDGDDLLLSDSDTLTVDYVRFGVQIPDDSEGRFENGTGHIECMIPTFSESNGFPVGIFEPGEQPNFEIYPNPATANLTIEMENDELNPVRIFTITGQLILEHKPASKLFVLNVSDLSPGMYLVRSDKFSRKLIIQ